MGNAHDRTIRTAVVIGIAIAGAACGAAVTPDVESAEVRPLASTTVPASERTETVAPDSGPTCAVTSSPPQLDPRTGVPVTTTTLTPPGGCPPPALPPGKVSCMVMYGTLLPGEQKDVPVYRTDVEPMQPIATIHLPEHTWTPAEAEDLCA
jgi:hypothetical protein